LRAVVTGAAGFIGAYLSRALASRGYDVVAVDNYLRGRPERLSGHPSIAMMACDVRDSAALTEAFRDAEVVFHLAAINGTENFYERPELVLDVGVRGALAVIDACRASNAPDLVVASSAEVYQTPAVVPTDEQTPMIIPDPLNPRYSYGGSKLVSELIAFNYAKDHFRKVQVFRPHNVYGPDMGWKHVIPQLIAKYLAARDAGLPSIGIQGDGSETRAFCYVDDVVDGIITMYEAGQHRNVYHIGSMEEVSIAGLCRQISSALNLDMGITPGPGMAGATPRRCPDITKMRGIGYEPQVSLREGIQRTVEWYRENPQASGSNTLL
jgi:UDP-glucose 4-epimerase